MVNLRLAFAFSLALLISARADDTYYRLVTYEAPKDLHLEASGLAVLPDGKVAVGLRRGEVWIVDHPSAEPATAENLGYHLFATGLHEILGLTWHDGALYATQRPEVTRLRDTDGDGVADEYLTTASGWGVSGAYHEYAYGPVFDREGNAYNTLNSSMGDKWKGAGEEAQHTLWRGWCVRTPPGGRTEGWAAGFRSPCGIGTNAEGDIFVTDQQGNWFGTNPLLHVRKGAFFGHDQSIPDTRLPGSPVHDPGTLPQNITTAEAIEKVPGYCAPAIWFPYVKMGQSPTGFRCDLTGGKFGPFENQLFVGEFVFSGINRVFLEKVDGEYQGACFPFANGFQCGVLSVNFLPDGSLIAGETNRGWNSYGNRPYGIQRLVWSGKTPLEVQKLELLPSGFRFTFTLPINPASLPADPVSGSSYTYLYHSTYGSPETDTQPLQLSSPTLSPDHRTLTVNCANLRKGYVHEFQLPELKSETGLPLLHRAAYYTLIRLAKP